MTKNAIWKKVQVNCIRLLFINWSLKGSLHVFQSEQQKYSKSGFFECFVPKHYLTDATCSLPSNSKIQHFLPSSFKVQIHPSHTIMLFLEQILQ